MKRTAFGNNKRARGGRLFDSVARELYVRNAELAVRNKTLSLLRRLDEAAMASLETEAMAENIVRVLTDELQFSLVAIALLDTDKKRLIWRAIACASARGSVCTTVNAAPIAISDRSNVCVKSIKTRRTFTTHSLRTVLVPSFSSKQVKDFQRAVGIKSVLGYPLRAGKLMLGVLVVGLNRPSRDLTRYERETMEGATRLVTIAVEKAQIYTSLRETTAKLAAANEKLRELDALKTEFLSIASHQLRTPLAVTKGYASMLLQQLLGPLPQKQRDAIDKILRATEELISLVNHLLDISRIETGRLVVRAAPLNVCKVARDVVDLLSRRAQEKKLDLTLTAADAAWGQGDEEKVKEIIMNYIDNAIKYTTTGSVSVRCTNDGPTVRVAVTDTGHGLTKSDRAHLFEKFTRGSASAQVEVSTGLGLYVCRRLAEAMGGRVWAHSRGKGQGSTFYLELPAANGKRMGRTSTH